MGQLPPGEVLLVETVADVATLAPRDPARLAFITQTTLSVDDTAEIVAALKRPLPGDRRPAPRGHLLRHHQPPGGGQGDGARRSTRSLVIGAPNSSNSQRLVEVGRRAGCGYAQLVQRAADIDWRALEGVRAVGITAGASAPEVLVEEVIAAFRARYAVTERLVETATRARRVQGAAHPRAPRSPDPSRMPSSSPIPTAPARAIPAPAAGARCSSPATARPS